MARPAPITESRGDALLGELRAWCRARGGDLVITKRRLHPHMVVGDPTTRTILVSLAAYHQWSPGKLLYHALEAIGDAFGGERPPAPLITEITSDWNWRPG